MTYRSGHHRHIISYRSAHRLQGLGRIARTAGGLVAKLTWWFFIFLFVFSLLVAGGIVALPAAMVVIVLYGLLSLWYG